MLARKCGLVHKPVVASLLVHIVSARDQGEKVLAKSLYP
jgi:hypothetical protein